jgi:hypothetical protein
MNRLNKILFIIFLILLSFLILTIPKINEISVPTQWDTSINYGREYIIQKGFISPSTNNGSWVSNLQNYGSQDIISKIFYAEINIITGIITFPNDIKFLDIFSFGKVLLMPIFGMFAYMFFSNKNNIFLFSDFSLIVLFSIFPLSSSLALEPGHGSTGTIISMAIFILILILLMKKNSSIYSSLIILISFSFFLLWHTWSYYLLIVFIVLFIFSFFIKNQNWKILSIIAIIFYITIGFYFNFYQLIYMPLSSIVYFIKNKSNEYIINSLFINRTTGTTFYSILQIIGSILIALIIIISFIMLIEKLKYKKIMRHELLLLLFLFSLGFMFFALFMTGGYGVLLGRALEPCIPLSIISAAYILVNKSQNKSRGLIKKGMVIILIILIISCLFSYLFLSKQEEISINEKEALGINFCGIKTNNSESIFSDFRLLPPLLRFNKSYLYLPYSTDYNTSTNNRLLSTYYEKNYNPSNIILTVVHSHSHIALVSKSQVNYSLFLPEDRLRPPLRSFMDNFYQDEQYDCFYSNGDLNLFLYAD